MDSPTNTGTDPWDIVAYEASMLFDLRRELGGERFNAYNDVVKKALVESACLHTRILVDILLSKDSGKRDDIRLNQLLPGFTHPSVQILRKAYGDGKSERSPCWILNKMIAHPTQKRGRSHDYTDLLKQLLPLIEAVWNEIRKHDPGIPSRVPNTTGAVDSRFCAKTSS